MKILEEWFVPAPWGKIAMLSWGNPEGDRILLAHGRQDSAATFIPLLDLLPDNYYYVSFDMPGHGLSDPFPIGVMITRFQFVSVMDLVVKHLRWKHFIYIAHSMGGELGLFYNAIRPNEITKFIHLDSGPALQTMQSQPFPEYFELYYHNYYSNYSKENIDERVYTKRKALEAVMNARGMTGEQAEVILSRNLRCIGEDQYKLSWDKRLKRMPPLPVTNDFYLQLFVKNVPPTLFIAADGTEAFYKSRSAGKLLNELQKNLNNFQIETVEGTHDVHFTNPDRVVNFIIDFLNKDFGVKSKL